MPGLRPKETKGQKRVSEMLGEPWLVYVVRRSQEGVNLMDIAKELGVAKATMSNWVYREGCMYINVIAPIGAEIQVLVNGEEWNPEETHGV